MTELNNPGPRGHEKIVPVMTRRIPLVSPELIAMSAHEVNRAYCAALGDDSQLPWDKAPKWQRESARMGVDLHLMGNFGPEASHISWMNQKISEGWVYGPVKNPDLKQHPCMVPFSQLPPEQQAKDYLFRGVVHSLSRPASETDDEIGSIETVDQFAAVLQGWHGPKVAAVKHMRDIPPGSEVTVDTGNGEAKDVKLEGDTLLAFQAGLDTALAELGTLPFVGSVEDEEPEQAANDANGVPIGDMPAVRNMPSGFQPIQEGNDAAPSGN
jgi:hypothetical protein